MGDLFLTMYICAYRNMSCSGMLTGILRVSCQPIEFYLPRGLDGTRSTTLRLRSVDEHAVPPRGCRAGTATYGVKRNQLVPLCVSLHMKLYTLLHCFVPRDSSSDVGLPSRRPPHPLGPPAGHLTITAGRCVQIGLDTQVSPWVICPVLHLASCPATYIVLLHCPAELSCYIVLLNSVRSKVLLG